ncbi:carcinoembryonic antigen-related cell adhesion molecule 1-like [Myripristis murdjan]|uniref:carcinoembryonic antigen-related cell adhesion molecule 1-like n=1 Tax=Myripristis murdjan TaxID=586833 RepID=UPI001175FD51|nr:carcinoembryonic antigen-related cell adhesion molecule 1-like [Myripristis murdjan]
MNHKFLRAALVLLTSGFCCGDGVIPVDLNNALVGGNVTFKTSIKPDHNQTFLAVSWAVNHSSIITSTSSEVIGPGYEGRVILNRATGSLELRNVTEEDSGEYELSITPNGGAQIQGSTKLKVYPKVSTPTMNCPADRLIEDRSSVNLTCDAEGVFTREWVKDGQPVLSGDRFTISEGGRVLTIKPIKREDTGLFMCNISNAVSFETAKCSLTVNYGPDKPTIIQNPETAAEDNKVTLTCTADSFPNATFTWMFNEKKRDGSVYEISELEEEHLGNYKCFARNDVTGLEVSNVHTLKASSAAIDGSVSMMVTSALTLVALTLA